MKPLKKDKTILRYTLFGIAFGLLFPIIAFLLDFCTYNDGDFSFANIPQRLEDNPVLLIILTAPFFLGLSFFIAGRLASNQNETNKKLSRVIEELRISNDSLDSFNYHVSHDLKTVINSTKSLTNMAVKYNQKQDSEKVSEVLKKLGRVAEIGRETVDSFLELSSAEQYLKEQHIELLDVEAGLRQLLREHELSDKIGVIFKRKDFEYLKMHPKAFESVMLNLVTNSIKYCTVKPSLQIELVSYNNHSIIVYQDNGIGMDLEKDKKNLFQPFVRLKNDMKVDGTGVGLYLVDKVMTSYSGKIEVDSELGKGTTFRLFFPKN
jgi:signal transduction histidine kinase